MVRTDIGKSVLLLVSVALTLDLRSFKANAYTFPPSSSLSSLSSLSWSSVSVVKSSSFSSRRRINREPLAFVRSQQRKRQEQRQQEEQLRPNPWILFSTSPSSSSSTSATTTSNNNDKLNARRRELLSRQGPHFFLDRSTGRIEFGATARLVTELTEDKNRRSNNNSEDKESEQEEEEEEDWSEVIADWLREEESFALSIWRPDLIEKKGNGVYRLQLMTLQFITLQLSPWVDLRMQTVSDRQGLPVFTLQSIQFEPNVKILPGVSISAETLGIQIEVVGQLRGTTTDNVASPSSYQQQGITKPKGYGVMGSIAFETQGKLPTALRILPDAVLRRASDAINQKVVDFAIQSFQTGAIRNFQTYLQTRPQRRK